MPPSILPALLVLTSVLSARAQVTVPGTPEAQTAFGFALAYGDFDGDGDDDLAVSAPGLEEDDLGYVTVLYLTADGRAATGARRIVQGSGGVPGLDEPGDAFGYSLAAGDFDGDGRDDLAIGAPGEDIGTVANAGAVYVLYGSDDGLTGDRAYSTAQDRSAIPGVAEDGDTFGWSLAAGDVGRFGDDGPEPFADGYDELVIGTPGEDVGDVPDVGAALVLYGAADGLSDDGSAALPFTSTTVRALFGSSVGVVVGRSAYINAGGTTGSHVVVGAPGGPGHVWAFDIGDSEPFNRIDSDQDDALGATIAIGDFDGDGVNDFAFGRPYASVGGVSSAGAVDVYLSTRTDALTVTQSAFGSRARNEEGDDFGTAVAASDLDGDGYDDLVVGAPGEDIESVEVAGAVFVLFGSSGGPTGEGAVVLAQDRPGIPGVPEPLDSFGYTVAASPGRLAIGVPFEDIGSTENGGAALALVGTADGVTTDGLLELVPGNALPTARGTDAEGGPSGALALAAPSPNPAASTASVLLDLAAPTVVTAAVYDALGRRVASLWDGPFGAGQHTLTVDSAALRPGLYLVHVRSGAGAATQTLTVAR